MNFLIQIIFNFSVYHLFKAVGWHRVVKEGSISNSVLKKILCLVSSCHVGPIHCFLVHIPLRSVKYLSWLGHGIY